MTYRYVLHDLEKQRVANYFEPGMPADILRSYDDFGDWTVLVEEPGHALMRHRNGAMMKVVLKDGKAMSYEIVEGDAARALDAEHGG